MPAPTRDSLIAELREAKRLALEQGDMKTVKAATAAALSIGWDGKVSEEDNQELNIDVHLDCVDTALYRHYGIKGELLYVGVSIQTLMRLMAHRLQSPWFRLIARIEIQWFKSKSGAYAAEKRAIKIEKPLWNKTHSNA